MSVRIWIRESIRLIQAVVFAIVAIWAFETALTTLARAVGR